MNVALTELWRAWRASLRRPGFVLLAAGVLALGIGASVAVFALINGTLLQRLPFPQASRVVVLGKIFSGEVGPISPHESQFLKRMPGVKALGLIRPGSVTNISGSGAPRQIPVTYIDRGLLPALGVRPVLGRNFSVAEDRPGGPSVVLLSHGLWQRRYGGARDVVGQSMQVEGRAATIIGVLPKGLDTLSHAGGIFLPLALPAASRDYDHSGHMAIARLAAGVSIHDVAAQADARERAMYRDMGMGGHWDRPQFGAATLDVTLHRGERPLLMLFAASAAVVLLIALVNLTNLMLLRTLSRSHDAAVRHALGAPFLRLLLPAMGEGLLVGVGGALVGMALAWAGLVALRDRIPAEWLHGGQITAGPMTWVFAFAVGIIGALLAACLGAWRSRRAMGVDTLREGGRSGLGRRSGRLGRALVVAQVALAMALLSSAGVVAHSLYTASQTPLGFSSEHILTFDLAPVKAHYPDGQAVKAMSQRLVQRLRLIPGVTKAAVTTNLPAGDGLYDQFNHRLEAAGGKQFYAQLHGVGNGFFQLFSMTRYQGRVFTHDDTGGSEPVAVVSRDLANRYYDGHAMGKLIKIDMDEGPAVAVRIVGVVTSTYQYGPLAPRTPVLYLPLVQMPASTFAIMQKIEPLRFALHVQGRVGDWRAAVQKAVAEVAPNQPISHVQPMRRIVRQTTANARLSLWLISLFAALALLLAVAGLYAVMAVAVASREREFGTRMALGASPVRMTQLIVRGGMYQVAIGLLLGIALAWGAVSVLAHMSAALSVTRVGTIDQVDPLAWSLVCVVLALAGFVACLRPAWRASRVPPMCALRGE